MTSFEGLSVIVTGLSVLGSERKETTSWPPYRPISALLSKSSSLGFSTGFCRLSGLAHSAAAARRAARSRSRQLVMRPFPPVLRSGWISDQYGFHPLVKSVCQRRVSEKERHQREPRKRSEEHTSELQSLAYLVCRLLLEKKKKNSATHSYANS